LTCFALRASFPGTPRYGANFQVYAQLSRF
jgi:hypothetical protein